VNEKTWKSLLRKAMICLDSLSGNTGPFTWSLGGGTVLMLHYEHRLSKDIDIFLADPQLLTFLSPRLNDEVSSMAEGYDEQSSWLKITLTQGEIDFVVAPVLTSPGWERWYFEGRTINRETPVEIAAKKVFYRAAEFKARDIFDLAFVLKHEGPEMERNRDIFMVRAGIIKDRLQLFQAKFKVMAREQINLLPKGRPMLDRAWETVDEWFKD
jgi:hypothetical protein